MKIFKKLTTISLGAAMLLGLGLSIALTNKTQPIETKATAYSSKVVCLDTSSFTSWENDGARFALYCFNDTQNEWVSFTNIGSHVFLTTTPSTSYNKMIFCRMNGSNTTNSWANKWNQSQDCELTADQNKATVTAWNTVTLSTSTATVTVATTDATAGTVTGSGTYNSNISKTIVATPNTGYSFGYWSTDDGVTIASTSASYTFTVPFNATTYKAYFNSTSTITLNFTCDTANTYYAYCWNSGSGSKNALWPGVAMSDPVNNVYSYVASTYYDCVIFNDNSKQTDTLTISNLITKAYGSNISFHGTIGDTITGQWYIKSTPTLTSSYARIWLDRGGNKVDSGNVWALHVWNSTGTTYDYEIMPSQYTNFSNTDTARNLVAYDVPTSCLTGSYQFKLYVDTTGAYGDISTQDQVYTAGDNAKLVYITNSSETYTTSTGSIGDELNGTIKASSVVEVFKAYYSCISDKNNGYGAITTLESTWIKKGTVYHVTTTDMQGASMSDCETSTNYSTGTRGKTTTLYLKYTTMLYQYNSVPLTIGVNETSQTTSAIVIGSFAVISFLGLSSFYFFKKKKLIK